LSHENLIQLDIVYASSLALLCVKQKWQRRRREMMRSDEEWVDEIYWWLTRLIHLCCYAHSTHSHSHLDDDNENDEKKKTTKKSRKVSGGDVEKNIRRECERINPSIIVFYAIKTSSWQKLHTTNVSLLLVASIELLLSESCYDTCRQSVI
jgi:hypothetical protein